MFGPTWEREYDKYENDNVWVKEYDHSDYAERVVQPDHGDVYTEIVYDTGQTYREYGDGTTVKMP